MDINVTNNMRKSTVKLHIILLQLSLLHEKSEMSAGRMLRQSQREYWDFRLRIAVSTNA